jgi:hypothetical protein
MLVAGCHNPMSIAAKGYYPPSVSAPVLGLCGQRPHMAEKRESLAYEPDDIVSLWRADMFQTVWVFALGYGAVTLAIVLAIVILIDRYLL